MTIPEALALLEVSLPLTRDALKKAYRHALLVWHPDRFQGNPELLEKATNKTRAINEAFEILKRHATADEHPKQAPPFQRETRPDEPRQTEADKAKTEHKKEPDQADSPPEQPAAHLSFWQTVLLVIVCAPAFYVAKLAVEAGKTRQNEARSRTHLPSQPQFSQNKPEQRQPTSQVVTFPLLPDNPLVQMSLTLPGSWLRRQPQESNTALKFADPSLTEFVQVRIREVSKAELPFVEEWSTQLAVLSNGTQLPEPFYEALLPDGSRFVSAVKSTTDWYPSVAAVWEKVGAFEGEQLFARCQTSYFHINGYLVAIECMVGGPSSTQGIGVVRQKFATISPVFDEILLSAKISSLHVDHPPATSAPHFTQSAPPPASPLASPPALPPALPPDPPSQTTQLVENQIIKEDPSIQTNRGRSPLRDLRDEEYLVPDSQYARLLTLRDKALAEMRTPAKLPATLRAERRKLDEEKRRFERSLAKLGSMSDRTIPQQLQKLADRERDLQDRTDATVSPAFTQFQKEIKRVGTKAR